MLHKLYTLLEKKEDFFRIQLASKEHAVFLAHFPNHPLLPGFLMLEISSQILGHTIVAISKAKFIAPALPQDILKFAFTCKENKIKVFIEKEGEKIAELHYEKI